MEETAIDLRGILGLLRRQYRLIVIAVIVIVTLAGIVTFSLKPLYSSTALIMVDTARKNLLDPDAPLGSGSSDSARIDSEVEILRSDNVLLKVIYNLDLVSDARLGVSLSLREQVLSLLGIVDPAPPTSNDLLNSALNNLRSAVSVQRRGLTYLIAVSARAADPERAATLANAVAQAYIDDQLASKVASTLASRDALQARILQAREAITSSEGSFDTFVQTNLDRIAQEAGGQGISNIQTQIEQLIAARNAQSAVAERVQRDLEANDLNAVIESLQSSALEELQRQREDFASRLAGTDEGTPTAVDLQAEIAAIDERLRSTASDEVETLRASIASSQDEENRLRQDLRTTVLSSPLPADILTELFELQQNAELARNQYQLLLQRVQELEAQADLQLADSRIVSAALPPQSPSFPNRTLIMGAVGLLAVAVGVALAFLYENFIGGFTSEAQLRSVLKTKVATAVPRLKERQQGTSLADMMITAPLSVFAESIRRLRTSVQQSIRLKQDGKADGAAVIMITSTTPNEGKTTIALALARSFALSDHRTLVIDCDLRKPSLHRHLGLEPSQGLHEYLLEGDSVNLTTIISKDSLSVATAVVGSRRSDVPTDQLLTGRAFSRLIDAAKRTFDIVIIDTPPVGPVVDSLHIAPFADAIVYVTRWASTSQVDAKQCVGALMESKAPEAEIIAVINQQNEARASYMRRYGDYYAEPS